ncbi:lipopolysaccharide biosynthesis protein [Aquimarina sp. 2-A2]|uniref:lipopolysaccharide biosynthesis protein n=1 Tax=Aquimarina sp. 2-A2 TaxID=3382644 RepID=UPI00387F24AC
MANSKSLFNEIVLYSVGNFGSKILTFLLLPLYTFFLTKEDMGEYDLFFTTVTLFVPLVSLQISDAVYRWLISEKAENLNYRRKVISNSILIFISSFSIFFFVFSMFFSTIKYAEFFIALVFLSAFLPFLQNILRGLQKTKAYAINGILTTFLILLFNCVFLFYLELKVIGILAANIIAYTIVILHIVVSYKIYRFFYLKNTDLALIWKLLKYSLPLIPNLISWWVINSASKFIILDELGIEENGIYAVSVRFPSILIVINSVLILPIQDFYLKETDGFNFLKKTIKKFIYFELSIVLILSAGAPLYSKILIDNNFYESWVYMPLLFLGVGFNSIATLVSLVFQKELNTLKITITSAIGGFVSIGLSLMLINSFELQGVSFSFFVGYLILFIFRIMLSYKKYNFEIDYFKLLSYLLLFFVIFYLQSSISFLLKIVLFMVVLVTSLYLNREFFSYFLEKIKLKK